LSLVVASLVPADEVDESAPADEKTVYEIGSISRQIAANAVLSLAEDGELRLDDPISKFLPPTPPSWSPITIRHVLTHTAGLADFDTGDIVPYRADGYLSLNPAIVRIKRYRAGRLAA
jgi:CubicO group peptidase (beta-lactamase class C family)